MNIWLTALLVSLLLLQPLIASAQICQHSHTNNHYSQVNEHTDTALEYEQDCTPCCLVNNAFYINAATPLPILTARCLYHDTSHPYQEARVQSSPYRPPIIAFAT